MTSQYNYINIKLISIKYLTHKTKSEVKENGGWREKVCRPLMRPHNNLGIEDDGIWEGEN